MRRCLGMVLLCLTAACSSGPTEAAVVSSAAEHALVPAIGAAGTELGGLSSAVTELCQAHDTPSHEAAMEAWRRAKTVGALRAHHLHRARQHAAHPIQGGLRTDREPGIDELLASDTVIDVDYVDNRAASTERGLGAIEYGLFRDLRPPPINGLPPRHLIGLGRRRGNPGAQRCVDHIVRRR